MRCVKCSEDAARIHVVFGDSPRPDSRYHGHSFCGPECLIRYVERNRFKDVAAWKPAADDPDTSVEEPEVIEAIDDDFIGENAWSHLA